MPSGVYERPVRGCTEDGCTGKHLARGLCSKHYNRLRTTGTLAPRLAAPARKINYNKKRSSLEGSELKRIQLRDQEGKVRRVYGAAGLAVLDRIRAGESCEICGGRTQKMAIDHDHQTGIVRGLLCGNCNTAIGLLKEDYSTIIRLIDYLLLDRHESALEQLVAKELSNV